jgi:hypothetical protein
MSTIGGAAATPLVWESAVDGVIVALWRNGLDTCSIARVMRLSPHVVANRLAVLRDEVVR